MGTIEDTPFYQNAVNQYCEKMQLSRSDMDALLEKSQPLGRIGTSEEVAQLVTFLCSSLAMFITGACIAIDGGYTAQ